MKLYHGSTVQVKNPALRYGRESTDFGKGFYTTTNFEQAKNWALSKTRTNNQLKAIVSIYEVDDDLINKAQYNTKIFTSPNKEWLDFVVNCRKSIRHSFDMVKGAVANDKIYVTINLFESGALSMEAALMQLKINPVFDQISFHSENAINELRFIQSEEVSKTDEI